MFAVVLLEPLFHGYKPGPFKYSFQQVVMSKSNFIESCNYTMTFCAQEKDHAVGFSLQRKPFFTRDGDVLDYTIRRTDKDSPKLEPIDKFFALKVFLYGLRAYDKKWESLYEPYTEQIGLDFQR